MYLGMRISVYLPVVTAVMLSFTGCGRKNVPKAEIIRLDELVATSAGMDRADRSILIDEYEAPLRDYIGMMGLSSGDLEKSVDSLANSAAYKVFYPDVVRRFVEIDSVERVLGSVRNSFAEKFPSVPSPVFYGVISPFRQPIMLLDSAVYIALNHYLGSDYPGYDGMPAFVRSVKSPDRIPADVAEAVISVNFRYRPSDDETVLSRMLYEGALLNAVEEIVGGGDNGRAVIFGWNDGQLDWAERNEKSMWDALVGRGMLYSSVRMDLDRLFSPSPATAVLSPEAPGRMGRFLGYRIVKSYRQANSGVTLDSLLSEGFYNNPRSLIGASYSPGS